MDTKSDEQLLVIESTIEANKQEANKNHKETDEKIKENTETLKQILAEMNKDKNNISKYSPAQKDTSNPTDPTTTVQTKRRDPPLEGGTPDKICGMWTLKHDTSPPKFYELLIKTELKGETALDLKNFFKYIKMCLNAANRLREDVLPNYQ